MFFAQPVIVEGLAFLPPLFFQRCCPTSGSVPDHAGYTQCSQHSTLLSVRLQLVHKLLQSPKGILLQMHSDGLSICKRPRQQYIYLFQKCVIIEVR